jgi:hypothetical protein
VLRALDSTDEPARRALAEAARRRILAEHTAVHRAAELEAHLRLAATRRTQRDRTQPLSLLT